MTRFAAAVQELPQDGRPVVVTVGTFDGVHRGHQQVIRRVVRQAAERGGRSVLVTFDPHPLQVVRPRHAPKLLTTPAEKKPLLATRGLDHVVFLAFTPELRDCPPRRFVREFLLDGLKMSSLVIGHDHGFGKGRSGNAEMLARLASEENFALDVVDPVRTEGAPVSSSAVRRALAERRLDDANRAMDRFYSMTGTVVRGDGRGRELGFPTANLRFPDDKLVPAAGIYACRAATSAGRFAGALHVGPRPAFPGAAETVEVHLLEFDGDLYGQQVALELASYVRPVAAFDDARALAEQIARDVKRVRRCLAGAFDLRSKAVSAN